MNFDIVVPSLRGELAALLPILSLESTRPDIAVRFFVVVDNGDPTPAALLEDAATRTDLQVIHAGRNEGASAARNRGIDAGSGDFILFLDDDVVPQPNLIDAYVNAIERDGDASPGYVGVTRFPSADSPFSRGVIASDILTFFDLSAHRPRMAWGVTANLCLRRKSLGPTRFSSAFPKAGGGEDIDLCLRMHDGDGEPFVCVPEAVVAHPWWPVGRGSYKRFARWALGDGRLPRLHPRFRYLNFPTLPETALIAAVLSRAKVGPLSRMASLELLLIALAVELGIDYAKLRLRGQPVDLRTSAEATFVRLSNDLGRLVGNLSRGRLHSLGERFDYFCTGESIRAERIVAGAKLAALIAAVTLARGRLR